MPVNILTYKKTNGTVAQRFIVRVTVPFVERSFNPLLNLPFCNGFFDIRLMAYSLISGFDLSKAFLKHT